MRLTVFRVRRAWPASGPRTNYSTVTGLSVHQSLPVSGAKVQFKALSTGAIRVLTTNEAGLFSAPALPPDDYELTTAATGFAALKQSLHLEVGEKLAIDIGLKVGAVQEGVQVSAAADVLRTTDASVGEVVERAVGPGTSTEWPHVSGSCADRAGRARGFWRADRGNESLVLAARTAFGHCDWRESPQRQLLPLDGATNTDPTFNTQNLSPSPDAVMEFQVETSSYTADMGGAGGGQINIVTRGGTNTYHGTAYEFLRNGAMDATTFGSMGNNHLVQNNFGASFGGPLLGRDKKTFFFLNYEGLRLAQADAQILTVPTTDEIGGDFSMSNTKIYDPTTAVANPNYDPTQPTGPSNYPYTRSQFPNNQIPSDRINPQLEAFLMQYRADAEHDDGELGSRFQ